MVLTRAANTMRPGADGVLGDRRRHPRHTNTTTSFVDQNQTYTSHPSHQVFLREYVHDGGRQAVATGQLLDGAATAASATGPRSRRRRARCWASC